MTVVVGVMIDKSRCHEQAGRIEHLGRVANDRAADVSEYAVGHRDIANDRIAAGTVDNQSAFDHEFMHVATLIAASAVCR